MTQKEKLEQAYILMCQAEDKEAEIRQIRWNRREEAKQEAMYADNRRALKEQRAEKMKHKGMLLGGAVSLAVLIVMYVFAALNASGGQMSSMYLTMGTLALLVVGPVVGKQMMEKKIEKLEDAEKKADRREKERKEEELRLMNEDAKALREQAKALLPAAICMRNPPRKL